MSKQNKARSNKNKNYWKRYQKIDVSAVFETENLNHFVIKTYLYKEIKDDVLEIYNEAESINNHSLNENVIGEDKK